MGFISSTRGGLVIVFTSLKSFILVSTPTIFKSSSIISLTVFHPLVVNNLCAGVYPPILPWVSSTYQVSRLPLF